MQQGAAGLLVGVQQLGFLQGAFGLCNCAGFSPPECGLPAVEEAGSGTPRTHCYREPRGWQTQLLRAAAMTGL